MRTLRYYLLALSLIIAVYSCNKKDDTTPTSSSGNTTVATCTDGIKNQNETGIDCGGVCPPCDTTVVAPCTQTANTSDFPIGIQDDTYNTSCGVEPIYNNYTFVGNGSASDMTMEFNGIPSTDKVYLTTNSTNASSLTSSQVIISTVAGGTFSYLYYANSFQDVYVNVNGTTITAEFCSLTFNSPSSGAFNNLMVSGFLQCN